MMINQSDFNNMIDDTILKPHAETADIKNICEEAICYGFHSVAVNSGMVKVCAEFLKESNVKVDVAVGFPLGITTIGCKVFEAKEAIDNGAGEVDYVLNIGKLKEHDEEYIRNEMQAMVKLCRQHGVVSKVIFENCYLTDEEKAMACRIALEVKPDYIKTSTGFGSSAATIEDVRLMKSIVGNQLKVKAAGGIRDLDICLAMIDAGASRIGCSNSVFLANAYAQFISNREELVL